MLNKIKSILTKNEKKKLVLLCVGTLFLAFLETFSIGIVIPIMNLFVNQSKIHASRALRWFYGLTGAEDNKAFLEILVITAMVLFIFKAVYALFMLYWQRKTVNDINVRITSIYPHFRPRCFIFFSSAGHDRRYKYF